MERRFSRTGFERSAKADQRLFRHESGTISEDAKQPADDKGMRNPHLLALGHEEENLYPGIRGGQALDFFGERSIKWWKSSGCGISLSRLRQSWTNPPAAQTKTRLEKRSP